MSDSFTFDTRKTPLTSPWADDIYGDSVPEEVEESRRRWWFVRNAELLTKPDVGVLDRTFYPSSPVYAYDIAWLYEMWSRIFVFLYDADPCYILDNLKSTYSGSNPDTVNGTASRYSDAPRRIDVPKTLSWDLLDMTANIAMRVISFYGYLADRIVDETFANPFSWDAGRSETRVSYWEKNSYDSDNTRTNEWSVPDPSVISSMSYPGPICRTLADRRRYGMRHGGEVSFRGPSDPGDPDCTFTATVPDGIDWCGATTAGRDVKVPILYGYESDSDSEAGKVAEYLSGRFDVSSSFMLGTSRATLSSELMTYPALDAGFEEARAKGTYYAAYSYANKYVMARALDIPPGSLDIAAAADNTSSIDPVQPERLNSGDSPVRYLPACAFGAQASNWWKHVGIPSASGWWEPMKTLVEKAHVPPAMPLDLVLDESDPYSTPFDWTNLSPRGYYNRPNPSRRCGLSGTAPFGLYVRFLADALRNLGSTFTYSASYVYANVSMSVKSGYLNTVKYPGESGYMNGGMQDEATVTARGMFRTGASNRSSSSGFMPDIGGFGSLSLPDEYDTPFNLLSSAAAPYGSSGDCTYKDTDARSHVIRSGTTTWGYEWSHDVSYSVSGRFIGPPGHYGSRREYGVAGRLRGKRRTSGGREWYAWESYADDEEWGSDWMERPFFGDGNLVSRYVKSASVYAMVATYRQSQMTSVDASEIHVSGGAGSGSSYKEGSETVCAASKKFVKIADGVGLTICHSPIVSLGSIVSKEHDLAGAQSGAQSGTSRYDGDASGTWTREYGYDRRGNNSERTYLASDPVAVVKWDRSKLLSFDLYCPAFESDESSSS